MPEMMCNSKKCTNGKVDDRFRFQENPERFLQGTWQKHEYVSSKLDKVNGWKVDGIRTQGGCRDSRADYRTVRCLNCGRVSTWDFAKD